jgi:hypothetical protein
MKGEFSDCVKLLTSFCSETLFRGFESDEAISSGHLNAKQDLFPKLA